MENNEEKIEISQTLYEMNKNMVAQTDKPLKNFEIKDKLRKCMPEYFSSTPDINEYEGHYYMLLCREKYDFTLFFLSSLSNEANITQSQKDMFECLTNRGLVLSIDLTPNKDAIEIWIQDEETKEAFVYYFFFYDNGVIEVIKD